MQITLWLWAVLLNFIAPSSLLWVIVLLVNASYMSYTLCASCSSTIHSAATTKPFHQIPEAVHRITSATQTRGWSCITSRAPCSAAATKRRKATSFWRQQSSWPSAHAITDRANGFGRFGAGAVGRGNPPGLGLVPRYNVWWSLKVCKGHGTTFGQALPILS